MDKGEFLKEFGADIYFDDQQSHCESAYSARQRVATGHVPYGVANGVVGVARLAVQGFPAR